VAESEYSEAEEAPVDEVDVSIDELSSVQQNELTARLFSLRESQAQESMELINRVEKAAKKRKCLMILYLDLAVKGVGCSQTNSIKYVN
jgi:hypothetical protein